MKGTLEDGTPVDIEKPEPIEQDGKWWEFNEFRPAKNKENTLDHSWDDEGLNGLVRPVVRDTARPYWIASEIPRATAEQLRAIGMKERDGGPRIGKSKEIIWHNGEAIRIACNDHTKDGVKLNNIIRFVLVPDVQGYTPLPEEPRFSVAEIKKWLEFTCDLEFIRDLMEDVTGPEGIAAFTERRRDESKMR
jgi:hypothetical protein